MYVVVSYDMADDKRRLKVSKELLNYGKRVQESVFECIIDDKNFLTMKEGIEKNIDFNEDSVRYYIICKKCISSVIVSGLGTYSEEENIIII